MAEDKKFKIKFLEQKGSIKFYITHSKLKGRFIKHIGKGSTTEYPSEITRLGVALNSSFEGKNFNWIDVGEFMDHYVNELKRECSILDYKDEFITKKRTTFNKQTTSYLSYSAINTYIKAIEYFDKFLTKKNISSDPSSINATVLDDYFVFLSGKSHNYKVKLHGKLKAYIKYAAKKGFQVDPSYAESTFTEEYDNQETEEDDRSLTKQELTTLNNLRQVIAQGLFSLPAYKTTKSITEDLQKRQRKVKITNIKNSLDCFLFMVATGQYISDIKGSRLNIKEADPNTTFATYRRKKNNSYCKSILIHDDNTFIGKTLLREYNIKSKTNFPMKLSLNSFNQQLEVIGKLAGFDFKLTSKMARKTFASLYYFDYKLPVSDIQSLLGHKDSRDTMHYLRIEENDLANRMKNQIIKAV